MISVVVPDEAFDAWLFATRRQGVDAVWRRGRRVIRDGEHLARTGLKAAFRSAMLPLEAG